MASQPAAIPKNAIPRAQMSWNGCRRRRHWSSSATAMTSARTVVSQGRRVVTGSGLDARLGRTNAEDARCERDPELLEDLDGDQEAREEEHHPEELADEE